MDALRRTAAALALLALTQAQAAGQDAATGFKVSYLDLEQHLAYEIEGQRDSVLFKTPHLLERHRLNACSRAVLSEMVFAAAEPYSRFAPRDRAAECLYGKRQGDIEIARGESKRRLAWCTGQGYPLPFVAQALSRCDRRKN